LFFEESYVGEDMKLGRPNGCSDRQQQNERALDDPRRSLKSAKLYRWVEIVTHVIVLVAGVFCAPAAAAQRPPEHVLAVPMLRRLLP
jgi:hypothetical protein